MWCTEIIHILWILLPSGVQCEPQIDPEQWQQTPWLHVTVSQQPLLITSNTWQSHTVILGSRQSRWGSGLAVRQFGLQCLFHQLSSRKWSFNHCMISIYWPMGSIYSGNSNNQFTYIFCVYFSVYLVIKFSATFWSCNVFYNMLIL